MSEYGQQIEVGQRWVMNELGRLARLKNFEWGQSPKDFDASRWTLRGEANGHPYREKFSESDLADCQNDSGVQQKLAAKLKRSLSRTKKRVLRK